MTETYGDDPLNDENTWLREGERLDDLERNGLKLIQNPSWFCFGMDAVLLTAFTRVREGDRCLDLCTGNGVIPILLSGRTAGAHFDGIELQEDIADMAGRSVGYNRIEESVCIRQGDIREVASIYGAATMDVVTCNPPYLKEEGGRVNPADHKAIARHEICATLKDVLEAARLLLVSGGHFYMVHRPFRLAEIMEEMIRARIEPKRLRMVYPYVDREPTMILVEGVRGGRSGMVVEKPLVIYEREGVYTEEVRALYEG